MRITDVRIEGQNLILVTEGRDAFNWVYLFKPGDYDIVLRKNKRSLDANAYCWTLIDKLAEKTCLKKSEVYRNAIKEVGGASDTICMKDEAVDTFCKAWEGHGMGWQTDTYPSKLPGCTNVVAYYGSSCYTTAQMSRLIDSIIEDCRSLGIETLPPERLSALLSAWDAANEITKQ